MLKRYFDSTDFRSLKIESNIVFIEIASGVYHVEKDRVGQLRKYVSHEDVVSAMNFGNKTTVKSNNGIFANFELDSKED